MRAQLKSFLRLAAVFAFANFAASPVQAEDRCGGTRTNLPDYRALGIVEACIPIEARRDGSILELPTEAMTKYFGLYDMVQWASNTNSITFRPPKEHPDFVICNGRRSIHAEIPGKGRYVKHGATASTASTLTYAWDIRRRSRNRNSRVNVDVYVSMISADKLQAGIDQKICIPLADIVKPDDAGGTLGWRQ